MPSRPVLAALPPIADDDARAPYARIAGALEQAIEAGAIGHGTALPSVKQITATYAVSVGTAHRALAVLAAARYVEVQGSRGARVVWNMPEVADAGPDREPQGQTASATGPRFINLKVRCRGQVVSRLMAVANPRNPVELSRLLVDTLRRAGRPATEIGDYEMDIRDEHELLVGTFVVASPA
jgi:DNA-binding transcriptional regulator YhcF (GntR family)